ncbi:MAG: HEPN domain-containing protein [Bacteroidaceae bacterium]|nr:HEPN domain-containing protein [Bacteroidaceae bacterium]
MNETLDTQSRKSLVEYRLSRANETINEAELLAKEGYYNAAANRLYYACYYAAQALLVANNITTATHAGVKTMLGLHFVSKDLLEKEHGRTFSRLFEIRHSGDYDDFVYCDKDMIDEYKPKAVAFINKITELLREGKTT